MFAGFPELRLWLWCLACLRAFHKFFFDFYWMVSWVLISICMIS